METAPEGVVLQAIAHQHPPLVLTADLAQALISPAIHAMSQEQHLHAQETMW